MHNGGFYPKFLPMSEGATRVSQPIDRESVKTLAVARTKKNKRQREWWARNREALSIRRRKRNLENREQFSAIRRANRAKKAEKYRELGRDWARKNPERKKLHNRTYYQRHTEKLVRNRKAYFQTPKGHAVKEAAEHRRRARKRGSGGNVTAKELRELKRNMPCCYYCGTKGKLTYDHVVPLKKGGQHVIVNMVMACQKCNCAKGSKLPEEFAKEIGCLLI